MFRIIFKIGLVRRILIFFFPKNGTRVQNLPHIKRLSSRCWPWMSGYLRVKVLSRVLGTILMWFLNTKRLDEKGHNSTQTLDAVSLLCSWFDRRIIYLSKWCRVTSKVSLSNRIEYLIRYLATFHMLILFWSKTEVASSRTKSRIFFFVAMNLSNCWSTTFHFR